MSRIGQNYRGGVEKESSFQLIVKEKINIVIPASERAECSLG